MRRLFYRLVYHIARPHVWGPWTIGERVLTSDIYGTTREPANVRACSLCGLSQMAEVKAAKQNPFCDRRAS